MPVYEAHLAYNVSVYGFSIVKADSPEAAIEQLKDLDHPRWDDVTDADWQGGEDYRLVTLSDMDTDETVAEAVSLEPEPFAHKLLRDIVEADDPTEAIQKAREYLK